MALRAPGMWNNPPPAPLCGMGRDTVISVPDTGHSSHASWAPGPLAAWGVDSQASAQWEPRELGPGPPHSLRRAGHRPGGRLGAQAKARGLEDQGRGCLAKVSGSWRPRLPFHEGHTTSPALWPPLSGVSEELRDSPGAPASALRGPACPPSPVTDTAAQLQPCWPQHPHQLGHRFLSRAGASPETSLLLRAAQGLPSALPAVPRLAAARPALQALRLLQRRGPAGRLLRAPAQRAGRRPVGPVTPRTGMPRTAMGQPRPGPAAPEEWL
ncbi:uncharacterized protein LOC115303983 [Suricata suricatta]|uniref:uncharacterized protein LOC115303983 n=1 Tax=Suricata suricatta TaxID=37032 RepID=UPI001155BF3D|nr:uncharacterized protein LOC115303983 [Suricata suricatta]